MRVIATTTVSVFSFKRWKLSQSDETVRHHYLCAFLDFPKPVVVRRSKRILANYSSNIFFYFSFEWLLWLIFIKANASHETVEAKVHQMNEKLTAVSVKFMKEKEKLLNLFTMLSSHKIFRQNFTNSTQKKARKLFKKRNLLKYNETIAESSIS